MDCANNLRLVMKYGPPSDDDDDNDAASESRSTHILASQYYDLGYVGDCGRRRSGRWGIVKAAVVRRSAEAAGNLVDQRNHYRLNVQRALYSPEDLGFARNRESSCTWEDASIRCDR